MRSSAFDPPAIPRQFWARSDVRQALEHQDIGTLLALLKQLCDISQTRIGTATGLGQPRVSRISRGLQAVETARVLTQIADGLSMPDDARVCLGLAPCRPHAPPVIPGTPDEASAELLRRITSARYLDDAVIQVLQGETDAIRLLDRRLGAPAVAGKLRAHIDQLRESLRHTLSPQRREHLALVLADAAALAGWQAIDMGRLPAAWTHFETATAAAREARDPALLAFAAGEQAYVLLDLGQPELARERVCAVREHAGTTVPHKLRGWLHAAEAEMSAAARDQSGCRLALDLATAEISHPQAEDSLPYLALAPAHLARWRGNCLVQLGDSDTITDLTTALAGMDGTFNRAEAGLRCDLAAAMHAAGESHEARRHLVRANELAQLTGSARQRRRVIALTKRIGAAA